MCCVKTLSAYVVCDFNHNNLFNHLGDKGYKPEKACTSNGVVFLEETTLLEQSGTCRGTCLTMYVQQYITGTAGKIWICHFGRKHISDVRHYML